MDSTAVFIEVERLMALDASGVGAEDAVPDGFIEALADSNRGGEICLLVQDQWAETRPTETSSPAPCARRVREALRQYDAEYHRTEQCCQALQNRWYRAGLLERFLVHALAMADSIDDDHLRILGQRVISASAKLDNLSDASVGSAEAEPPEPIQTSAAPRDHQSFLHSVHFDTLVNFMAITLRGIDRSITDIKHDGLRAATEELRQALRDFANRLADIYAKSEPPMQRQARVEHKYMASLDRMRLAFSECRLWHFMCIKNKHGDLYCIPKHRAGEIDELISRRRIDYSDLQVFRCEGPADFLSRVKADYDDAEQCLRHVRMRLLRRDLDYRPWLICFFDEDRGQPPASTILASQTRQPDLDPDEQPAHASALALASSTDKMDKDRLEEMDDDRFEELEQECYLAMRVDLNEQELIDESGNEEEDDEEDGSDAEESEAEENLEEKSHAEDKYKEESHAEENYEEGDHAEESVAVAAAEGSEYGHPVGKSKDQHVIVGTDEHTPVVSDTRRTARRQQFREACERFYNRFNACCQARGGRLAALPLSVHMDDTMTVFQLPSDAPWSDSPPRHAGARFRNQRCIIVKMADLATGTAGTFVYADHPLFGLKVGSAQLYRRSLQFFTRREYPSIVLGISAQAVNGDTTMVIASELLENDTTITASVPHLRYDSHLLRAAHKGLNTKQLIRRMEDWSLYDFFETLLATNDVMRAYQCTLPREIPWEWDLQLRYLHTIGDAQRAFFLSIEIERVLDTQKLGESAARQFRVKWKAPDMVPEWILWSTFRRTRGALSALQAFQRSDKQHDDVSAFIERLTPKRLASGSAGVYRTQKRHLQAAARLAADKILTRPRPWAD